MYGEERRKRRQPEVARSTIQADHLKFAAGGRKATSATWSAAAVVGKTGKEPPVAVVYSIFHPERKDVAEQLEVVELEQVFKPCVCHMRLRDLY